MDSDTEEIIRKGRCVIRSLTGIMEGRNMSVDVKRGLKAILRST